MGVDLRLGAVDGRMDEVGVDDGAEDGMGRSTSTTTFQLDDIEADWFDMSALPEPALDSMATTSRSDERGGTDEDEEAITGVDNRRASLLSPTLLALSCIRLGVTTTPSPVRLERGRFPRPST